jgi:alginate O-acetyltransferase complex protein AlgJ
MFRAHQIIPVVGTVALVALAIPVNWAQLASLQKDTASIPTRFDDVVTGRTSAAATEAYNRRFMFRDLGIEVFGSLAYTLFREGRPGIIIGKDDWLFTSEEFESDPQSSRRVARAIDFITEVRDALQAKEIQLVVALLPSKARIYPERLPVDGLPKEVAHRYSRTLGALTARGVRVVDLESAFRKAKADVPLFLRTDTHWTPHGAKVSAQAVAASLAGQGLGEERSYATDVTGSLAHAGDLMRYIRVLPFLASLRPPADQVPEIEAVGAKADEAGDLFGETGAPVALIGTSYSANARFGFEAHLKVTLGCDVINRAQEGQGPFAPMRDLVRELSNRPERPRVVVWEIPERYLDDDYPDEHFQVEKPQ